MAASKLTGIVGMRRVELFTFRSRGFPNALPQCVCIYPVEKTEVKPISVFFYFQNHQWVDHSVIPTSQDEIYFM